MFGKKPQIVWHGLGYGEATEVLPRLPGPGQWVVICDEDAALADAPSAWFAAQGEYEALVSAYLAGGGTVSASMIAQGPLPA